VTEGIAFNHDDLISLPSTLPLLRTLQKELSQPTASKGTRMRLVIDKQPEGTRSPNLADAIVMAYWPVGDGVYSSMEWV
jgi:phage terminase large subunit